MSKVDFYILPTDSLSARLDFACKLCDKAWRLGHRVYLHCQDAEQRSELDQRLWHFKGEAFVPHDLAELHADATVALGIAEDAGHFVHYEQPDLAAAYANGSHPVKPMKFGLGYLLDPKSTCVIVGHR